MFKYEKFNASSTVSAPPVERVVEFSPSGLDAGDVARVLSLAVDGKAVSAEAGDGYAAVSGRVNFRLVYQNRDGAVRGVDYNADFNLKVEGGFAADDSVGADVSVVEADVKTSDSTVLSAVVSVSASAVRRTEEECLVDAEKCYKTVETVTMPSLVAAKSVVVNVGEEAEAGDVDSVLLADAQAVVTAAAAGDGKITVEGKVRAAVTYTEDGEIRFRDMVVPFSEEIAADGVEEGDNVSASAYVRASKIVLAGVPGANVIRFEADVAVRVSAVRCRQNDVVADMFMLTNEVELGRESRKFVFPCGLRYTAESITGTASLEDRAPAESVVAVPYARCYAAKAEVTDSGALVEGVLTADVVYRDENGLNSVRAEVPYSVEIDGDFGAGVKAVCFVESVKAKARRGELDIEAEVGILVLYYACCEAEYISSVTVGEEKERNDSALSLYIVSEGDEMWDVCKALTATPDDVLAQNPSLSLPLAPGDRVVYFRTLA